MDGLQNILNEIAAAADASAAKLMTDAEAEARRIVDAAEKSAEAEAAAVTASAAKKADALSKAAASELAVTAKKERLTAERALVSEVLLEAEKRLASLDAAKRFDYILSFAEKNAEKDKKGEIRLCASDLASLPAGFSEKAAALGLAVASAPADISGGAVISYGDIEINGSFGAVADSDRERLTDIACRILFPER